MDNKIKDAMKSPLVFSKGLTDVLYNNVATNTNKKTNQNNNTLIMVVYIFKELKKLFIFN